MRRGGFTLVEVVMALLVLQAAALGVLGTLTLAQRTVHRAERLERAATRVEMLLDSLRSAPAEPDSGHWAAGDLRVRWWVEADGGVLVVATDDRGGELVRARGAAARVPRRHP
mgnify:FL=1